MVLNKRMGGVVVLFGACCSFSAACSREAASRAEDEVLSAESPIAPAPATSSTTGAAVDATGAGETGAGGATTAGMRREPETLGPDGRTEFDKPTVRPGPFPPRKTKCEPRPDDPLFQCWD